jgi:hypothetical protein
VQLFLQHLGDLEFVERSNKIHIEKLLNGLPIVLWNGANNINTIQNTKGSGDSGVLDHNVFGDNISTGHLISDFRQR